MLRMSRNRKTGERGREAAERFGGWLRQSGRTFTSQRRLILEEVLAEPDHFDAEQLAERLRRRGSGASRATLYRTLAHLEQAGFLRRVGLDAGHAHYEPIPGARHHEHLVCERCGAVVEVSDPTLERRIGEFTRRAGFQGRRHDLLVVGLCPKCREPGP
jgi:Fur family ferric uptake transcriptional regulator